jgi:hypothetical protein
MKNIQKKGAISIFIIIGLGIILSTSILFYIQNFHQEKKTEESVFQVQKFDSNTKPVYLFVEECIKRASVKSAYIFGKQQGYYDLQDKHIDVSSVDYINYYYFKDNDLVKNNDFYSKEFAKILDEQILLQCSNFSIFTEHDYEIELLSDTLSNVNILNEKLLINVDYPMIVSKNNNEKEISKYYYELPVRIGHLFDISRNLVGQIKKEPDLVDMTYLLDIDVDVSIVQYDECNKIYFLLDYDSKNVVDDEPYVFMFGVGFSEEYCVYDGEIINQDFEMPSNTFEENEVCKIDLIPDQKLSVGEMFSYKIKGSDPDGDTLYYFSNGILKNSINILTGEIEYVLNESDKGMHLISVSAIDHLSNRCLDDFYLEVE